MWESAKTKRGMQSVGPERKGVSAEEVWMSARCHKTTWEMPLALIRVNEVYEERKVLHPWEKVRARGFNRRSEGGRVGAGLAWGVRGRCQHCLVTAINAAF